jgi:flavodoxin/NAD-dependent dihydropyrimidine dehydrogenase PreA subunit
MKCIVLYYSQTGNTEKIARAIQSGIKQTAGNCDLVKINDADPKRLYEYDLIGIGSPAFGVEPPNVSQFIRDMRFVGGKHAFAFCTHGTHPEPYFPNIYPKLKERQLTVIGMGHWYSNCYLLHMPETYPTKGHPDEIDLKEAQEFGKEMVERSRKISGGETGLIPDPPKPPPPPSKDLALGPGTKPGKKDTIESFSDMLKFHKEKCKYPKCRLCMDNCPANGIDLSLNPPVIANPCVMCEFCTRVCPTGALDMDEWVAAVARDTLKMVDFLFSPLEKAEKEGKFRRLLPKDQINLDVAGYMVHKKHPNWIIGKGPN